MPSPLLETKLFHPRPRRDLVPRPRLRERLDRGLAAKVTLLSAPPGFGKTTVLADWLAAISDSGGPAVSAAWLSLDSGDNDPATFWNYVIGALSEARPGSGADALDLLQEPQRPAIELVLTTLINDLATAERDLVLVLDDYHVIDSLEVQAAMEFLVDHLPSRVHLVIASRADPALPLPRLRARGDLIEIRAADLRFTSDEAAAYLNGAMGLGLTPEDADALGERTEGWIAALQLAALSMAGREDLTSFVTGFAGNDRYVVDYLVEEVLQRQSNSVQQFLLATSVLDRLTGSLCDALTGQSGGRTMLESLDRDNLFLVPLDGHRQWYRYHHLFADVLQARLVNEDPDRVGRLHRLASDWYEQNGDLSAAIRHAMIAGDFAKAADLVEMQMPALRRDRREATLRGWLEGIPDDVIRLRPVLCNGLAGARLSTGSIEGVERLLDDAERWLASSVGQEVRTGMVVVDHEEFDRLPAGVAVHRAGLALVRGNVDDTVHFAQRALAVVADDDHLARGAASALTGLAAWTSGDLEVARTSYAACLVDFERIGHVSDVLGCSITLADIQITQGRLRDAMRTFEQALELASRDGSRVLRGTADMYVGRAALSREHDELAEARRDLMRSRELGEHLGLPQNAYRWCAVMAQVCAAEGDLDAATDLIDEAELRYVGDFSPNVRPLPAVRARLWLRQGRVGDALVWVTRQGLSATDDLSYLQEFEHVTLARVLIAQHLLEPAAGHLDQASVLLGRLLGAAEAGQRQGSVIEIRILQALMHQTRGELAAALASLEIALGLAEPEGYARTFIDEGVPMTDLLTAAAEAGVSSAYIRRLQTALPMSPVGTTTARAGGAAMIEPLSSRERDVLRLLNTDLSGPEIARELVVSLNTVRTHTKNLYMKLGVNNRRAAVRRAHELDLL